MKLHGHYRSSASFRVRIALNLKGIAYEDAFHNLSKDEQCAPDYLKLNPQGFVPTLEDEGELLLQSMATIEYLDETHPFPPLLPGHPGDRARVRAIAQIICCDIHPVDTLRILRYLSSEMTQDEAAVQRWSNHWIAAGFQALERFLAGSDQTGRFCHGDAPTLADICLVPQVVNAVNSKLDLAPYPTIQRIHDACLGLAAFERALPKNQSDAE